MRFSVFGVKLHISVPFTVMIAFLLIVDKTGLMSASLAAVAVHELGHIIAMRALKCLPKEISLRFGGILICGSAYCTFGENAVISFSGPFANFLIFGALYPLGVLSGSLYLKSFAVVQAVEGAMNLFPVKGLDGGTLIKLFLNYLNIKRRELVFNIISFTASVAIFVVGTAVAVENVSNPSLLLLGIYLIILNIIKT